MNGRGGGSAGKDDMMLLGAERDREAFCENLWRDRMINLLISAYIDIHFPPFQITKRYIPLK